MISDNYVTGDNIYLRELQNFFFEVLGMMSITHYGAVGDGRVDNYGPLQVAIDDAHRRGLSYLYVPYGRFIYTGELINLEGITFMGNPHAKIINIRTEEEIPVYQFGWVHDSYYDKQECDDRFVNIAGDTMTGSLAIGENSVASGSLSFAQGDGAIASGIESHAEGWETLASKHRAHAEGQHTRATGYDSHAEGYYSEANGDQSHAEGHDTRANGVFAHSEGYGATAGGNATHAEGYKTIASGKYAHAENNQTTASGNYSHAENSSTTAAGASSHAEGYLSLADATGAHAEGYNTKATYQYSHAEGSGTTASGLGAHAEGSSSQAMNHHTHAAGHCCQAKGISSTATGWATTASRARQFVIGQGNVVESGSTGNYESTTGLLIAGNGTVNGSNVVTDASNALKLTYAGDLYIAGTLTPNGADYAEMMEWADGNPNNEDRVGMFAVIENDKIRIANSQDVKELMGVISAFPTVLGDSFESYWHGKYVTDVYGRIQYETVTIPAHTEGEVEIPETTEERPIISPDYDPSQEYIPREQRKEFAKFAMLGKLVVEDDGTCEVGGYCYPNDSGIATKKYEGFYVMARIDANHVKIFVR